MTNTRKNKSTKFDLSLTTEQVDAKKMILDHPISFIEGRAGSGKTLLAVQIALDLLFKGEVDRIVVTRPTIGTEDNGFLPGTFQEKMQPWLVPIRDNMRKLYNRPEQFVKMEEDERIELISLTHFRGRTFDRAACIIDEFQNLTKQQLIMAVGRLGKGSIMMFCGDRQQIDLRGTHDSAIHEVSKLQESKYVYCTTLLENHRHPAVDDVLNILCEH